MELDALIEEVIVDANGEDEQLWEFRHAFKDALSLPADGFMIGEPGSGDHLRLYGNERRGLQHVKIGFLFKIGEWNISPFSVTPLGVNKCLSSLLIRLS